MKVIILKKLILITLIIYIFNISVFCKKSKDNDNITSKQAYKMMKKNKNNPDMIIIDVRTPGEYEAGHVENAINIDYTGENFTQEINKLDKTKTYLIYCRSGNRSSKAIQIFKKQGFTKIYNFGGIIQWQQAGYELVQ